MVWDKFKQTGLSVTKRFFPTSEGRPSIGLDIGNFACKAVVLKRSPTGYQLLSWAKEPVVGGDRGAAVRTVLAKLNTPAHFFLVTALSGKGTLTRFIEMPKMPLEDLKKSFAIEADKYFPFPLEQIYTDCYILDPSFKGNKMLVLVAAVKKDLVDQRLNLLSGLGIQADVITLSAVAIANVSQELGGQKPAALPPEQKTVAVGVVDIGEVITNLTIFLGGMPRFIRDIFIGGRDFTRAINNSLGVKVEEADRLKTDPGERRQVMIDVCDSVAMNIVTELRLSLDYFITEENLAVSQLFLTGGSSALPGLEDFFAKNLDLKVSRWNPLVQMGFSEPSLREEFEKNVAQLTVASGLALSGL